MNVLEVLYLVHHEKLSVSSSIMVGMMTAGFKRGRGGDCDEDFPGCRSRSSEARFFYRFFTLGLGLHSSP